MSQPPMLGAGFNEVVEAERAHAAPELFAVGSMLSYEERLLLHWATRAGNASHDAVVDAGCFLGGSTLGLAGGVAARADGTRSPVHVYDLFEFGDESQRAWVPEGFDFGVGQSTLPVFEHQVASVRPLLTVHRGDVREVRWDHGPVGVLFIDIAKSWSTGDAIWQEFFPALVPGRSLVIQQDLVHWGHPWCAIVMELLADRFEYLGWVWYSSAVYRCTSLITPDDLPPSLLDALSPADMLSLLDRAAERVGDPLAGSVRLSGAVVLGSHGDVDGARARVEQIRRSYGDDDVPYISEGYAHLDSWLDAVEAGHVRVGNEGTRHPSG